MKKLLVISLCFFGLITLKAQTADDYLPESSSFPYRVSPTDSLYEKVVSSIEALRRIAKHDRMYTVLDSQYVLASSVLHEQFYLTLLQSPFSGFQQMEFSAGYKNELGILFYVYVKKGTSMPDIKTILKLVINAGKSAKQEWRKKFQTKIKSQPKGGILILSEI